ncbi:MAG: OsmC family protein [Bacteroidota bacterium]|nr:OsmC family protein [Bacteroidota bacterium]
MASINSEYRGELRTNSIHTLSGNEIITDAPIDNNGKGEAFSPTDLVCTALCTCMLTIMGIVARKEDLELSGLRASITKIMADSPRKISEIHIDFVWEKPTGTPQQKQKLKSAALSCPVALSINPSIYQKITFSF